MTAVRRSGLAGGRTARCGTLGAPDLASIGYAVLAAETADLFAGHLKHAGDVLHELAITQHGFGSSVDLCVKSLAALHKFPQLADARAFGHAHNNATRVGQNLLQCHTVWPYYVAMSNATVTAAAEHRCLRPGCHRKLTSPASIAAGYGRKCLAKIRQAALDAARADFTPAQRAKADELISDGGVVAIAPGLYEVTSSDGEHTYACDGHSCTCDAGWSDKRCYHLLAVRILNIAARPARPSRRSLAKAA